MYYTKHTGEYMDLIRLVVLPLAEAKSLQDDLHKQGVELVLNHNEQTCTRGCAVTVEVMGYQKDLEIVSKTYHDNYKKLTEGLDVNWEAANSVFDSSKDEAICPACSFKFSTSHIECPDCGLVLG